MKTVPLISLLIMILVTISSLPIKGQSNYVNAQIYFVTYENYRVQGVVVSSGAQTVTSDEHGLVTVACLPAPDLTWIQYNGGAATIKRNGVTESHTFSGGSFQVDASNENIYYVNVDNGSIYPEYPPLEPGNWWNWFLESSLVGFIPNWLLLLIAILLLFLIFKR